MQRALASSAAAFLAVLALISPLGAQGPGTLDTQVLALQ